MKTIRHIIFMLSIVFGTALGNSNDHGESVSRLSAQMRSLRAREILLEEMEHENHPQTNEVGQQDLEEMSPEKTIFPRLNITSSEEIYNLTDWESNDINPSLLTTIRRQRKDLGRHFPNFEDAVRSKVTTAADDTDVQRTGLAESIVNIQHLNVTHRLAPLSVINTDASRSKPLIDHQQGSTDGGVQRKANVSTNDGAEIDSGPSLDELIIGDMILNLENDIFEENRVNSSFLLALRNLGVESNENLTSAGPLLDEFGGTTYTRVFATEENVSTANVKQEIHELLKNNVIILENDNNVEPLQQKGRFSGTSTLSSDSVSDQSDHSGNSTADEETIQGAGTLSSDGVFDEGNVLEEDFNISNNYFGLTITGNGTRNEQKLQSTDHVLDEDHIFKEDENVPNHHSGLINKTDNDTREEVKIQDTSRVLGRVNLLKGVSNAFNILNHRFGLNRTGNGHTNEKTIRDAPSSDRVLDKGHPLQVVSNVFDIFNYPSNLNRIVNITTNEKKNQGTLRSVHHLKHPNLTNIAMEDNTSNDITSPYRKGHDPADDVRIIGTLNFNTVLDLSKDANVSSIFNHHSDFNRRGKLRRKKFNVL